MNRIQEENVKTEMIGRKQITTIQPETKYRLLHVIEKLASHVEMPVLDRWRSLSDEELWHHIVTQVCVMGSALPMEKLHHTGENVAFESALSLSTLSTKLDKVSYIERQLIKFKATRFQKKAALRLAAAAANSGLIQGNRVVLLNGLLHDGADVIREELLRRTKFLFKRKSVSDFMIAVGLSNDVIALDQRVVGLLNKHFNYNRNFSSVQASRSIYLSVEDCLRCICKEANITLGNLDRMLFKFAGLTAVEYLARFDISNKDESF